MKGYRRADGYVTFAGLLGHRLVLEAFAGPCPPGMEARHLNGVRDENRPENLAWGTRRENAADRFRHGTIKAKLTAEDVPTIRALYADGWTQAAIGRRFGVTQQAVSLIVTGKVWRDLPDGPPIAG